MDEHFVIQIISETGRTFTRIGVQTKQGWFAELVGRLVSTALIFLLARAISLCKGTRTPAAWMQEVGKEQRLAYSFWLFTPGCQNIQGSIAMTYRLLKHRAG